MALIIQYPCEFRSRLIAGGREEQLLNTMLEQFKLYGWIKSRGKARTDSTHILAAIRCSESTRGAWEKHERSSLNELATVAPQWLLTVISPDWFEHYSTRFEQYRLPKTKAELEQLAVMIGQDGHHLLTAVYSQDAPVKLASLVVVEILRQVWVQQYYFEDQCLLWRTSADLPPHHMSDSVSL